MKSIIQAAMYIDRTHEGPDRWCDSNTLPVYNKLDHLSRVTHLVRQSFILRYCQLVYGDSPPPVVIDYKETINELLGFETSNTYKYRLETSPTSVRILEGLEFAKILLEGKYNDYIFDINKIVSYFLPPPMVNETNDIPNVISTPFLKVCLNFWNNNTHIRHNRPESINAEAIAMVKVPNIKVSYTTLLVTDNAPTAAFDSYVYSPNLITDLNSVSPLSNLDSLQSLSVCLNWNGKNIDDFSLLFAQYALTLDVFALRKKGPLVPNNLEYRNLINAGMYQLLASKFIDKLINANTYSEKYCPALVNSILVNIYKLRDNYDLVIDDSNIINNLIRYSKKYTTLQENKDNTMYDSNNYKNSILPVIFQSTEAVQDDAGKETDTEDESSTNDTETKKTVTKTTTKDGDTTTTKETDETEEVPVDDASEEPTDKEGEETPDKQIPDIIKSTKKGDKSKKVVFELQKDVTLDVILLRDEISHFINNTLEHPPENIDANDLSVLKRLKMYWINILSIQTTLDIISNIMECPIIISKTKE